MAALNIPILPLLTS